MVPREPTVWDNVFYWGWRKGVRRLDRFVVGALTFTGAFVVVDTFVPEVTHPTGFQRLMHVVIALLLAFAVVAVVVGLYTVPISLWEQRNEAKRQLRESLDEISRRDRVEFAVSADDPEVLVGLGSQVFHGKNYGTPTGFFVTVNNTSDSPCRFSAEVDLVMNATRLDGQPQEAYWAPIAWEITYEADTIELGPHTRKRLYLAQTFNNDSGRAFAFVGPQIQAWNEDKHGMGLMFVPNSDTIEFAVKVINHATGQPMIKKGLIRYLTGAFSFSLTDPEPGAVT